MIKTVAHVRRGCRCQQARYDDIIHFMIKHLRSDVRRSCIAAALLSMLLAGGCARQSSAPPATLDSLTHDYLRLCVALGERDPDALDFYSGPEAQVAQARTQPPALEALRRDAVQLRDRLTALPQQTVRVTSLAAQVDAVLLRTSLLTSTRPASDQAGEFDRESRIFFGIQAGADADAAHRAATRAQIAALIPHSASPAHAYSVFDARFVVPPGRVPAIFAEALQQCRAETLRHIAMPAGEHVDIQYVGNKPWSAFSRYLGNAHSVIQINMDHPMTVDRILNLACHEGYPGHHVFNTLRDQALVQQQHLDEYEAQLTYSPQSFVSEAAASYAPDIVFPGDERLRIERDVLFPLAGLDPKNAALYLRVSGLVASLWTAQPSIARDYLEGRLEFIRAADALERETLMEHSEYFLLYLNEYRSYMLTYTIGREMIEVRIEAPAPASAPPSQDVRWQRYRFLMTHPITALPPALSP